MAHTHTQKQQTNFSVWLNNFWLKKQTNYKRSQTNSCRWPNNGYSLRFSTWKINIGLKYLAEYISFRFVRTHFHMAEWEEKKLLDGVWLFVWLCVCVFVQFILIGKVWLLFFFPPLTPITKINFRKFWVWILEFSSKISIRWKKKFTLQAIYR